MSSYKPTFGAPLPRQRECDIDEIERDEVATPTKKVTILPNMTSVRFLLKASATREQTNEDPRQQLHIKEAEHITYALTVEST